MLKNQIQIEYKMESLRKNSNCEFTNKIHQSKVLNKTMNIGNGKVKCLTLSVRLDCLDLLPWSDTNITIPQTLI
ncbi:MAG: hypothetical protein MHPSP_002393, partial [Paramarteilia canceri]